MTVHTTKEAVEVWFLSRWVKSWISVCRLSAAALVKCATVSELVHC